MRTEVLVTATEALTAECSRLPRAAARNPHQAAYPTYPRVERPCRSAASCRFAAAVGSSRVAPQAALPRVSPRVCCSPLLRTPAAQHRDTSSRASSSPLLTHCPLDPRDSCAPFLT